MASRIREQTRQAVAHQECAELREQIARAIEAMRQDAFDMHGEDDEPYYATVSQTLDAVLDVVDAVEPLIRADEREQPVPEDDLSIHDAKVEAKVRAQIAADIEAARDNVTRDIELAQMQHPMDHEQIDSWTSERVGLNLAARIALGES